LLSLSNRDIWARYVACRCIWGPVTLQSENLKGITQGDPEIITWGRIAKKCSCRM
jgi:hypothetical protein